MLTIRQFNPKDMYSIIKLASKTLTEDYNPNLFNFFYETFPQGFWVAEQNHKNIGFIVGLKTDETNAKILMIAVHPQYKRKRIGTNLLKQFMTTIKQENVKKIDLEVRKSNLEAIKFYKKHGFLIKRTLKNFYKNNEDGYIMEKTL